MKFKATRGFRPEKDTIFLIVSSWDDYGYKTLFDAIYVDTNCVAHELGSVKIAKSEMEEPYSFNYLDAEFSKLEDGFFSLWQSAESYENVSKVEEVTGYEIFDSLNDIAYNRRLFDKYEHENVTIKSVMRFVSKHSCINQFARISHGEAVLTEFNFTHRIEQKDELVDDLNLDFFVKPMTYPPTNVHAIIGNNGVGKTTIIKNMICSICNGEDKNFIYIDNENDKCGFFESVMCVSFSPFDDYSEIEYKDSCHFIGIKKEYNTEGYEDGHSEANLLENIKNEFIDSFKYCMANANKRKDWIDTINILSEGNEFLLCAINYDMYTNDGISVDNQIDMVRDDFNKLSAGHKVVLSIVTRCIAQLAEKTILFIDEPENHLHPPLLSSMIRALSYMLVKRNGVAIISTHSPVVLQEIPKSCIWKLNRQGSYIFAKRPDIETFGTNIGVLTNEIFGYEVKKTGFNSLITKAIEKCDCYEDVMELFDYQMGDEAKSMVRILLSRKEVDEC